MSKQKISCKFYNYDKKEFRELEVDCRLNIFPCCFFLNSPSSFPFRLNLGDMKMEEASKVIENYFNEDMWNSDKPHYLCIASCNTLGEE